MAYCTSADVTALTGLSPSTSTEPTNLELTGIIEQISGMIQGSLNSIGITTVTSTSLSDMLRLPCSQGSAGMYYMRKGKNENDFRNGDWLYGKFEAFLDKLIKDSAYRNMLLQIENTGGYTITMSSPVTDGTFNSSDYDDKYINEEFTI